MLRAFLELHEPRGDVGQDAFRELDQRVRQRVVALAECLVAAGYLFAEAAQRLGISERTLRLWKAAMCAVGNDTVTPLGRPRADAGPEQQRAVLDYLQDRGAAVSVSALRVAFPGLSRAELDALAKCYRALWRAQNQRSVHVLHWQRPGTVWAMDFAEAPVLIDGRWWYLLAVRDLASGKQLLWKPVSALSAAVVCAELPSLFMAYGTPWVLKMDNGSAFIAGATQGLLARWQVFSLFSPPLRPSYNGSIEAAIGSLKTRTQRLAEQAGHPDLWTRALVEAARCEANASHPRRLHGATPDEVWDARQPLLIEEREFFGVTVYQEEDQARLEKYVPMAGELSRSDQAEVDRLAIRRALVAHGLLLFTRRSIPPRIRRPKAAMKG